MGTYVRGEKTENRLKSINNPFLRGIGGFLNISRMIMLGNILQLANISNK